MPKRCESIAPEHHVRCEKGRYHPGEIGMVHMAGSLVWGDPIEAPAFGTAVHLAMETSARLMDATNHRPAAEQELRGWWIDKAEDETDMVVAKAIEYGATDLIDIGLMLGRTMKRQVTQEEAAELGVFFYLIGKVSRWQSAIERGERPSDDTLLDIGVYVRMAQRIRNAGGWPGTKEETK